MRPPNMRCDRGVEDGDHKFTVLIVYEIAVGFNPQDVRIVGIDMKGYKDQGSLPVKIQKGD